MEPCPCQSAKSYRECCGPYISGESMPGVEDLVRARYTAFSLKNFDYVERTHASEVRADFNRAEAERISEECVWEGLYIHKSRITEEEAEVEYAVRVKMSQKPVARGVLARFRKEQGLWCFVSSKPMAHIAQLKGPKIGRNESCFCGSGKKYKKCHGSSSSDG